jgi:hypothetical protein
MSETLEERTRRHAENDDPAVQFHVYASDVVELLDERDATIAQLRAAVGRLEGERDAMREKEYQLREAIGWAYAGINNAERLLSLGGDPVPHLQAAKAHLAAALAADGEGEAG